MDHTYKMYYFPGRGRAEVSRLILAAAGKEFEDVRIPGAEWQQHKAEMPLGQMPVLEVDGVKYGQSKAIARFLAREFGFYGKTSLDGLYIDIISDTLYDIFEKYPRREQDETKKAELMKTFLGEAVPEGLKKVEKLLIDKNGGNGFFSSELSYADFEFVNMCDFLTPLDPNSLDCVPKLKALNQRVREIPKVKAWMDKRPKSEF